ncbi:MAG: hypothetical protein ACLSAM_03350 [Alistipes onderdonkii]
MLRGVLLLALAVTTAACGTRQARTGETGRKGRIIAVTDTILDTGGTDTVRFGRMHWEVACSGSDRKPGIEARSHHPIRPQLRVHDARI